jgi:hypothetical protein
MITFVSGVEVFDQLLDVRIIPAGQGTQRDLRNPRSWTIWSVCFMMAFWLF